MMNDAEISRLAHALNELRPDWPISSLTTWIRNNLSKRAYQDVAVALVWVALDRKADGSYATDKPARVLEAGPWWRAAAAGSDGVVVSRNPTRDEACPVCSGFIGSCRCTPEEIKAARKPAVASKAHIDQLRQAAGLPPKPREDA